MESINKIEDILTKYVKIVWKLSVLFNDNFYLRMCLSSIANVELNKNKLILNLNSKEEFEFIVANNIIMNEVCDEMKKEYGIIPCYTYNLFPSETRNETIVKIVTENFPIIY